MRSEIGLIGCGIWGRNILRDLIGLKQSVIVVDPSSENRIKALEMGATQVFDCKPENIFPKGWVIASPAVTHYKLLRTLSEDKVPIFVEKPLTCDLQEAEELLKIDGYQIFVMHNWLYHAGIQMLADIVKSGELGELVFLKSNRCNWTSPRSDVDSVWTLIPHDITIASYLLGYFPKPKAAVVEVYNGQQRGMTAFLGDEIPCVLEVSNRYADKRREVRLHFTKGVAVLKDENVHYIEIYHGDDQSKSTDIRREERYFDITSPLVRELTSFLDYLAGGIPPLTNLEDGVKVIQIIHELKNIAENGKSRN
jgi:predicted dehydrogenase